ncbi:MAG TPA: deoxyribodipyrimidine photo-lyase [Micromonosporaceae bacterium]
MTIGSASDDLLARRRQLNSAVPPASSKCVLYVMSRDQRTVDNHALLAAQHHAASGKLPLIVAFIVYAGSGVRAREHFAFMLDGLEDVSADLSAHGIPFVVRSGGRPLTLLRDLIAEISPAAIYVDFSPLRGPRALRSSLAALDLPVFEVDTHNVVPAWVVSEKLEFAARTIRPKIHRHLRSFLVEPPRLRKHPYAWSGRVHSVPLATVRRDLLPTLRSNGTTVAAVPGQIAARAALRDFEKHRLDGYPTRRNDPTVDGLSGLSPYFHYGQLATLRVALAAPSAEVLIEEMVVRKELSDNFCLYQRRYDSLDGAPAWALRTLAAHADDPRPYLYSYEQLDAAHTHDEPWNAAQRQLTSTGKMHGYMRMYWAKKILEWTPSAAIAIEYAIRLNDFYEIDGGDPNGYVGVLWSIAGVHDRPWAERSVFGQVRYMNEAGLRRKFKVDAYVAAYPE